MRSAACRASRSASIPSGIAETVCGVSFSTFAAGTFISFSEEAISLRTREGDLTVRRPDVRRVSLREHSKRLRNVLIGAAIGAGAGVAVGVEVVPSSSARKVPTPKPRVMATLRP